MHFYELGKQLTEIEDESRLCEASLRASTSRVYYAAYWAARIFVEKAGLDVDSRREGSHWVVLNWYQERNFVNLYKTAYTQLKRLREKRTQADYLIDVMGAANWRIVAEDTINDADQFFITMQHVASKPLPKLRQKGR